MKKFPIFVLLLITLGISKRSLSETQLVGFKNGNQMTSYPVRASVHVTCQQAGQMKSILYSCSDNFLSPSDIDYFVGPAGVDADKAELVCTQFDGRVVSKESAYDSQKLQSTKRFNLWIASLTQKPLLYLGLNKIKYNLKKNGTIVSAGEFSVKVDSHAVLDCGYDTYFSNFFSDCESQFSFCRKYFNENNYCQ